MDKFYYKLRGKTTVQVNGKLQQPQGGGEMRKHYVFKGRHGVQRNNERAQSVRVLIFGSLLSSGSEFGEYLSITGSAISRQSTIPGRHG